MKEYAPTTHSNNNDEVDNVNNNLTKSLVIEKNNDDNDDDKNQNAYELLRTSSRLWCIISFFSWLLYCVDRVLV